VIKGYVRGLPKDVDSAVRFIFAEWQRVKGAAGEVIPKASLSTRRGEYKVTFRFRDSELREDPYNVMSRVYRTAERFLSEGRFYVKVKGEPWRPILYY